MQAGELQRFSVSIDGRLLEAFDRYVGREGYPTRSKAVADLIAGKLVEKEWSNDGVVAGAIILVYDHHKRDLTNRLTHIQHDYHDIIISSQHVHLDHHNCLEVVVGRGAPGRLEELARRLKAAKGVKYCTLSAASTGTEL